MRSNLYSITGIDGFEEICEKLFNSPETLVHREILGSGNKLVIFEIEKAKELLKDDIKSMELLDSISDKNHECKCCGTHANYFTQDYRGTYCVSRHTSCEVCFCLNDKEYFRIMGMDTVELDYDALGFTTELNNKELQIENY